MQALYQLSEILNPQPREEILYTTNRFEIRRGPSHQLSILFAGEKVEDPCAKIAKMGQDLMTRHGDIANISHLKCHNIKLTQESMKVLVEWLTEKNVQTLALKLFPRILPDVLSPLDRGINLRNLSISDSGINHTHLAILAQAWLGLTHLEYLDLSSNDIDKNGVPHLASLIANISLKLLVLSENPLTSKGANLFSAALNENSSLINICLNNTKIGSAGALSIANMLTNNTTLTKLDLSDNNLGKLGRTHINRGLERNTTLLDMRLSNNGIGFEQLIAPTDPFVVKTFQNVFLYDANNESKKLSQSCPEYNSLT